MDSAAVSYHVQSATKKATEVVVVVAAIEIVARYEAAFRAAGMHPGMITTSALATFELTPPTGISIVAKLSGRQMSVVVANSGLLKLVRTVELADVSPDEIMGVLFPTLAYVEDEMGAHATRLSLFGFEDGGRMPEWGSELQVPLEPLRSRFGEPNGFNAGVLGYLESMSPGPKGSRGAKAA